MALGRHVSQECFIGSEFIKKKKKKNSHNSILRSYSTPMFITLYRHDTIKIPTIAPKIAIVITITIRLRLSQY